MKKKSLFVMFVLLPFVLLLGLVLTGCDGNADPMGLWTTVDADGDVGTIRFNVTTWTMTWGSGSLSGAYSAEGSTVNMYAEGGVSFTGKISGNKLTIVYDGVTSVFTKQN